MIFYEEMSWCIVGIFRPCYLPRYPLNRVGIPVKEGCALQVDLHSYTALHEYIISPLFWCYNTCTESHASSLASSERLIAINTATAAVGKEDSSMFEYWTRNCERLSLKRVGFNSMIAAFVKT